MKKLFVFIAFMAILVLSSCDKIYEEIADLNDRITDLEDDTIATINDQMSNINRSISYLEVVDTELNGYIVTLQGASTKLQKEIYAVDARLGEVQTTIENQMLAMKSELDNDILTAQADLLAQLQQVRAELEFELEQINTTISVLKAKDEELEKNISALRCYIDDELSKTVDWVAATYSTLEQYELLCSDIAAIKAQIEMLNNSIVDLEIRLRDEFSTDINAAVETLKANIDTAVDGLNTEFASQVTAITSAYTTAISSAKDEVTAAYTTEIASAVTNLEASMKLWVNEQLTNYYTIVQVDAMLMAMSEEFEGKLSSQKIYLESLISSLSDVLLAKINANDELIEALRNDLVLLDTEVALNAEAIAINAEKIAANAAAIKANTEDIIENSKQIGANRNQIELNATQWTDELDARVALLTQKIEANTILISDNKKLIEEVDAKIDNTNNAANAKAIAENARVIKEQAELIAKNSVAINNNTIAIVTNSEEIEKIKGQIVSLEEDITKAYTELVEASIETLEGKLDNSVIEINSRITDEVKSINQALEVLDNRVVAVENEIVAIKGDIALMRGDIAVMQDQILSLMKRIQSVTYVPKYSDGRATMDYVTKKAEFDFMISPKSAVEELATLWNTALSVRALYTQTRAVDFVELPIIAFEADNTNGVISLTVSGENLDSNFFVEQQDASAFLQISDGNSHIASDYIAMTPNYNIQFEDPAVKAICCRKWDTNGDAELSYEEAAAVKDIGTVFSKNVDIISFSELKYFTGLTHIAAEAFRDATNLLKVELPKNIAYLGESAFGGCKKIKKIDCPMFLDSIAASAFEGCGMLESINLQSVKNIGNYAFQSCKKLKYINLSYVESIGNYAFSGCVELEYLYIGSRVAQWGSQAFSNCTGELVCMSSAISEAFKSSKFTKATLDGEVYGNDLFRPYGQYPSADAYTLEILILGESVKEIRELGQRPSIVYCKSLKPPYIYNNPFYSAMTIYVPIGRYDAYMQGKDGWSNYSSKIEEYDFENNPI